jgi:ubiquinone/menaquinone biosynthesis C-methylase UbiE
MKDLISSYDRIAGEYARRLYTELDHKPIDRQLLDQFAHSVAGKGLVCDLGCGPGEVAHYLFEKGVHVMGMDLSEGMLAEASRLDARITFRKGDMLALPERDNAWAGIAAFYSIVHFTRELLPRALGEMLRVLQPGGRLLLAFHIGEEVLHVDEMFSTAVNMDFVFFSIEEMRLFLQEAGFQVEEVIRRAPYPDVEYQGPRGYIFAKKPTGPLAAEFVGDV